TAADYQDWLALSGRCVRRAERPDVNSTRCAGLQRTGHFGLRAHVETTDAHKAAALVPSSDANLLLQGPQITKAEGRHLVNVPVWLPHLTTRCPLRFDRPPGETSRVPRGKLSGMSEVTRILSAIEQGDPNAAAELLPLVYDELRKLAAARMAEE